MKPVSLTVEIDGHPLVLLTLRTSFGPALRCLFAADAQFGKDAVLRARHSSSDQFDRRRSDAR